jgi:O-antigen ligase
MTARGLGRTLSALLAVAVLLEAFPVGDRVAAAAFAAALASLALGIAAPGRGLPAAVFACTVTGAATSAAGPHGILPWPALIALWFGTGAAIRDAVRQRPSPRASLDRSVDVLGVFWFASAAVAALSARSLWALAHGLALRAVNAIATPDARAIDRTLAGLAAVFAGLTIFRAARRAPAEIRRRARSAFVAGAALSAAVAVLQSRSWIRASQSGFWAALGRFHGLASDPNAAGVVAALALGPAFLAAIRGPRRAAWALASALLAAGVAVSGSRSGILLAGLAIAAVAAGEARGLPRWARPALLLFAVAITIVLFAASSGRGGAAARLIELWDARAPIAYRTSSRGLFWSAAFDAFRGAPLGGIGWNAFSWQLPTLAAARGAPTAVMDNPGNFYLQLLCETGIAGAFLFAIFGYLAARAIADALRGEGPERASAASLLALAPALAIGSHLLAAETAIGAFLLLAEVAGEAPGARLAGRAAEGKARGRYLVAALVAIAGWTILLAPTAREAEAFRYSPEMGMYPLEGGVGGFRWMRPRAAIRVPASARQRLALVFPGAAAGNRLRILSGGETLFAGDIGRERRTLALEAPATRPAVFRFESAASFRPSDTSGSDSRLLSLQVFAARP